MKVTHNPTPNSLPLDKAQGPSQAEALQRDKAIAARESRASDAASKGATVEIYDNARLMSQAKEIASGAPDIRQDRVAQLKSAIASGNYRVDSGAIADRLLEEHLNHDFGKNHL